MTAEQDRSGTSRRIAPSEKPHIVGYMCPSWPEGPMKPTPFEDPCGKDKAIWSDGTMTDA